MFIVDLFTQLDALAKSMPVVGTTISLSLAGVVVAMFWKAPKYLSYKFRSLLVYQLTIDNTGYGDSMQNYLNFLKWFSATPKRVFSKSIGFENGTWGSKGELGPGSGTHFMFYKKSIYIIEIIDLPSEGSEKIKRQIRIKTLSFTKNKLVSLFNEFSVKDEVKKLKVYALGKDLGWIPVGDASTRKLNTVIIDKERKALIVKLITEFLSNEAWYRERGIPYKLIIMLYGPPGTGKTSIFKAVAAHFQKNSCIMDISDVTSTQFTNAIYNLPKNAMLAIEDFDSNPSTHQRKEDDNIKDSGNSITTILNAFDGIKELDGQVIFLSTNHIEKLDKAIVRPGRVDKCIYIPALTHVEINEYIELMYPNSGIAVPEGFAVTGSKLQELVIENKRDVDNFKKALFNIEQ